MEADNLKDGLHKPTFYEDDLKAVGKSATIQGWSSKPSLREGGLHAPMEVDNFKKVFTSSPFMWMAYMRQ